MINAFFRINLFWSVSILFLFSFFFTPGIALAQNEWIEQETGTMQSVRGITKTEDMLVAVGNSGSIMTSPDDGETWLLNTHISGAWWHDVTTEVDGDVVAVGESGTYAESSDQGQNWSSLSLGVSAHLYDIDRSSSYGYIVGSDATVLYLANGRWTSAAPNVTESLYAVQDNADGSAWIVGAAGRLLKATNGGLSWSNFGRVGTENLWGVFFESSSTGWVVGDNGTIKKTTDAAASWSTVSLEGLVTQDLYDIQVFGENIVVVGDGIVLLSQDHGNTWTLTDFTNEQVTFYAAYYQDESHLWIAGSHDDVSSAVYFYVIDETQEGVSEEETMIPEQDSPEVPSSSLIKSICEEESGIDDPCRAVYYYAQDGKRHAFPNENIFFTWFEHFDEVLEVSQDFLSDIPLGSNVTYHPGTRMVKFQSFPTVYAVSKGGLLRPIANEQTATDLYGADWNQQIDDLSDAFYGNYDFGDPIESVDDYDVEEEFLSVENLDDNF